jgi:hypothetical protein
LPLHRENPCGRFSGVPAVGSPEPPNNFLNADGEGGVAKRIVLFICGMVQAAGLSVPGTTARIAWEGANLCIGFTCLLAQPNSMQTITKVQCFAQEKIWAKKYPRETVVCP